MSKNTRIRSRGMAIVMGVAVAMGGVTPLTTTALAQESAASASTPTQSNQKSAVKNLVPQSERMLKPRFNIVVPLSVHISQQDLERGYVDIGVISEELQKVLNDRDIILYGTKMDEPDMKKLQLTSLLYGEKDGISKATAPIDEDIPGGGEQADMFAITPKDGHILLPVNTKSGVVSFPGISQLSMFITFPQDDEKLEKLIKSTFSEHLTKEQLESYKGSKLQFSFHLYPTPDFRDSPNKIPPIQLKKQDNGTSTAVFSPNMREIYPWMSEKEKEYTKDFHWSAQYMTFPRDGNEQLGFSFESPELYIAGNRVVINREQDAVHKISNPNEGTWEISETDGRKILITFTPVAGFTGTPTYPRIAYANFQSMQALDIAGAPTENKDAIDSTTDPRNSSGQHAPNKIAIPKESIGSEIIDIRWVYPENTPSTDPNYNPNKKMNESFQVTYPDSNVKPGEEKTIPMTGTPTTDDKIVFSIDKGSVPEGWTAKIDKKTGNITVKAPATAKKGDVATLKVTSSYPDGTKNEATAKVTVSEDGTTPDAPSSDKQSDLFDPSYAPTTVTPSTPASVTPVWKNNKKPEGDVTFTLGGDLPEKWTPTVDEKTGSVTVTPPADAKKGDAVTVPIVVTYKDGSKDETGAQFTVGDKSSDTSTDADRYTPVYIPVPGHPGDTVVSHRGGTVPEGTTFAMKDKPNGWTTVIDKDGNISATIPGDAPAGDVLLTVDVIYPDGSRETVPAVIQVTSGTNTVPDTTNNNTNPGTNNNGGTNTAPNTTKPDDTTPSSTSHRSSTSRVPSGNDTNGRHDGDNTSTPGALNSGVGTAPRNDAPVVPYSASRGVTLTPSVGPKVATGGHGTSWVSKIVSIFS